MAAIRLNEFITMNIDNDSSSEPYLKISGPKSNRFDRDAFGSVIDLGYAFFYNEGEYLLAFLTLSSMEQYKRNREDHC